MTTNTIRACRSKNPTTCPYHGSRDFHAKDFYIKQNAYLNLLREALGSNNVKKKDLIEAQEKASNAQASLEAHDDEYSGLVSAVGYSNPDREGYADLIRRKINADKVRRKLGHEIITSIPNQQRSDEEPRKRQKGDRVSLDPLGVGSINVEGTIIETSNSDTNYPSYKVAWDDGKFSDEWWNEEDFREERN